MQYSDSYDVAYPGQPVDPATDPYSAPATDPHDWYWWIKFLLARYNSNPNLLNQPVLPPPPSSPPTASEQAAYAAYDRQLGAFKTAFGHYAALLVTPIVDNTSGQPLPPNYTLRQVVPGTARDDNGDGVVALGPGPFIMPATDPITGTHAVIDFLEITNEPDFQMWPQRLAGKPDSAVKPSNLIIHKVVAGMFVTAQQAVHDLQALPAELVSINGQGAATVLAGPATAGFLGQRAKPKKGKPSQYGISTRVRTSIDFFTQKLLDELKAQQFIRGPGFARSNHNYSDMTSQRFTMPGPRGTSVGPRTNIAQLVRARLSAAGWSGWSTPGVKKPALLLTEGGVSRNYLSAPKGVKGTRKRTASVYAQQATRLAEFGRRLRTGPIGTGIALLTNFEFYWDGDARNSSNLCDRPKLPKGTIPPPPPLRTFELPAYLQGLA